MFSLCLLVIAAFIALYLSNRDSSTIQKVVQSEDVRQDDLDSPNAAAWVDQSAVFSDQAQSGDSDAEELWNLYAVIPTTRSDDSDEPCHRLEAEGQPVCWNQFGYHPILTYSLDALEQMALTDAAAAEALSIKLPWEQREKKTAYALLASDLSGMPGPLHRVVTMNSWWDNRQEKFERMALLLLNDNLGSPQQIGYAQLPFLMHEYGLSRGEVLGEIEEAMETIRKRSTRILEASAENGSTR